MEYIPGYVTLKHLASKAANMPTKLYEYYTNKNKYELFAGSQSNQPSYLPTFTDTPEDVKIARWSQYKKYKADDVVRHNGFVYTSIKESSNINPIKEIVDTFITVNDSYWVSNGLHSNVKTFDPETDMEKKYVKDDIVNFNSVLYLCSLNTSNSSSPSSLSRCGTDFMNSNQWTMLSSEYITEPTPIEKESYSTRVFSGLGGIFNDLTFEEIPGETLDGTAWRVFYRLLPYLFVITKFMLALMFASFTANDLLHKEPGYRILAFIYIFMFVFFPTNSYSTFAGTITTIYYIFRSLFGRTFGMNDLRMWGFLPLLKDYEYDEKRRFPTLYSYPASLEEFINEGRDIMMDRRLSSHGDIVGYLASALRVKIQPGNLTPSPNQGPSPSPNQGPSPSPNQGPSPSPNQGPTPSPNQSPSQLQAENEPKAKAKAQPKVVPPVKNNDVS